MKKLLSFLLLFAATACSVLGVGMSVNSSNTIVSDQGNPFSALNYGGNLAITSGGQLYISSGASIIAAAGSTVTGFGGGGGGGNVTTTGSNLLFLGTPSGNGNFTMPASNTTLAGWGTANNFTNTNTFSGTINAAGATANFSSAVGNFTGASLTFTGASITGLPATAINATGTPNSTTFLRGDNTWAAVSSGGVGSIGLNTTVGLTVSNSPLTSNGTLSISGGTLNVANGGTGASTLASGSFFGGNGTGAMIPVAYNATTVAANLSLYPTLAANNTFSGNNTFSNVTTFSTAPTGPNVTINATNTQLVNAASVFANFIPSSTANSSLAIGIGAFAGANGSNGFAIGTGSNAVANSMTLGMGTSASVAGEIFIQAFNGGTGITPNLIALGGNDSKADDFGAVMIGTEAQMTGNIAFGEAGTIIVGNDSISRSEGGVMVALNGIQQGALSTAIGFQPETGGSAAVALGYYSHAYDLNQVQIGGGAALSSSLGVGGEGITLNNSYIGSRMFSKYWRYAYHQLNNNPLAKNETAPTVIHGTNGFDALNQIVPSNITPIQGGGSDQGGILAFATVVNGTVTGVNMVSTVAYDANATYNLLVPGLGTGATFTASNSSGSVALSVATGGSGYTNTTNNLPGIDVVIEPGLGTGTAASGGFRVEVAEPGNVSNNIWNSNQPNLDGGVGFNGFIVLPAAFGSSTVANITANGTLTVANTTTLSSLTANSYLTLNGSNQITSVTYSGNTVLGTFNGAPTAFALSGLTVNATTLTASGSGGNVAAVNVNAGSFQSGTYTFSGALNATGNTTIGSTGAGQFVNEFGQITLTDDGNTRALYIDRNTRALYNTSGSETVDFSGDNLGGNWLVSGTLTVSGTIQTAQGHTVDYGPVTPVSNSGLTTLGIDYQESILIDGVQYYIMLSDTPQ